MIIKNLHSTKLRFFLVLLFSVPFCSKAQEFQNEKYLWFDSLIGKTNSGVFKGVQYTNEFRTINEKHQFFKTGDFKSGSVDYKGQDYFELLLRYDIYLDNLTVVNDALTNKPIMVFDKEGISKFTIEGHSFENLSETIAKEGKSGFFEILLKNEYWTLYKKHSKKIFKRTDEQNLYYEFKDGYTYVLSSDNFYYPFKKVKELNSIFPDYRKDLKSIQKKHSQLKKSDTDVYVKAVLTDLLSLRPILKQETL